jgi:hypothetical protein
MRPAVVLALVVGVAAPPLTWGRAPDLSANAGAAALASPSATICKLGRNSAKAEKTFAGEWAATLDRQPQDPASGHAIVRVAPAAQASHLDLDTPPIAPRPPPLE